MAWSIVTLFLITVALLALWRRHRSRRTAVRDSRAGAELSRAGSFVSTRASKSVSELEPAHFKTCPVCLSEYSTQNRFCVRDGAELVLGRVSGAFAHGMICPTCRRGYPSDARFCPEDADELVPYGLYGAATSTREPLRLDANKICPECGIRHAPAHLFCGQDGTELVVVN